MGQVVQTAKHAKIRHVPRQKPSAEALAAGFAPFCSYLYCTARTFPKGKNDSLCYQPRWAGHA